MTLSRERLLRKAILLLAVIGLMLSLYLLKEHLAPTGHSFCDINAKVSCDVVNKSPYAELLGIPISLFGALYYFGILAVMLAPGWFAKHFADGNIRFLWQLFLTYMLFGLGFSLYLTYIEAFVIDTWCPVCVASACIVLINTFLVFWLGRLSSKV